MCSAGTPAAFSGSESAVADSGFSEIRTLAGDGTSLVTRHAAACNGIQRPLGGPYPAQASSSDTGDEDDVISNDGLQSNTLGNGFGLNTYTHYPPRTLRRAVGVI